MRLPLNKIMTHYNISRMSHLVDAQETIVYHGSYLVRSDWDGRTYRRARVTSHDIQAVYWSVDNDNGRQNADKDSADFRGYETVEF